MNSYFKYRALQKSCVNMVGIGGIISNLLSDNFIKCANAIY